MGDFGLLVAKYNSSLPTLTDGQANSLQVDVNGRLLVQADVSVVIDFLGLNGAGNSSNVLIVGTEDGTGVGTAHAIKVESDGRIIVSDGGGSLTVDASNLDIRDLVFATDKVDVSGSSNVAVTDGGGSLTVDATDLDIRDLAFATDKIDISGSSNVAVTDGGGSLTVDASDLDIRDLSHSQDSVKIGDGSDFLAVNTDGSINVVATQSYAGSEAYNATDNLAAAADGLATITASATPWITTTTIAVGAGQTIHLYGMDWTCDANAQARLISDDATDIIVYKQSLNSSAMPDQFKYWGEAGRIEIAGSATMNIKLQIKKRSAAGGDALGYSSIHARIV